MRTHMLSEKLISWGCFFIASYAVCVAGFYLLGLISERVCDALNFLPCMFVAIWYLIAYYEVRHSKMSGSLAINAGGWALVGFSFLFPQFAWTGRAMCAIGGLCCILLGCAIAFLHIATQGGEARVDSHTAVQQEDKNAGQQEVSAPQKGAQKDDVKGRDESGQ